MTTRVKTDAVDVQAPEDTPVPESEVSEVEALRKRVAELEAAAREGTAVLDAVDVADTVDPVDGVAPGPREDDRYIAFLACGDTAFAPNPHGSHHHCDRHGIRVPVTSYVELPEGE